MQKPFVFASADDGIKDLAKANGHEERRNSFFIRWLKPTDMHYRFILLR